MEKGYRYIGTDLTPSDTPDQAGFDPLDTADASSDAEPTGKAKKGYFTLIWTILSNPIILMIGVVGMVLDLIFGTLQKAVTYVE